MKRDLVSPESAMFCTHLSHFGYAVQLLPERGFSYSACDEEMHKPQLVLTLLKIISLISMVYQSIDIVTLSIVYLNISKAVALNVLILSCRTVSTMATISVDI